MSCRKSFYLLIVLCQFTRAYTDDMAYRITAAIGPYFVVDPRVVEDRWDADRFVVPLTKHEANPLIVKTGEWEGSGPHMGGSVVFDPADGLFKMWYTVFSRHNYDNKLPFSYNVCYAESDDGYTWRKPALGVFDEGADPANNCIKLGTDKTQNIDVMLNPLPDRFPGRFLAIHNQKGGVRVSSSDDGHTFTMLFDEPAIAYHSDTHNNFLYDEAHDRWLMYCRPRAWAGNHRRRVAFKESADLHTWTHERTILIPEEDERQEYYGMGVFRLHDMFFGFRQSYSRDNALLYPELVWSGDGEHWESLPDHPAVLPVGEAGSWDAGMVLAAESPVLTGDEMRFYYGGFALPHDEAENPCGIGLATAERDRLVGVRPRGEAVGYLITRPFVVPDSAALHVNATVEDGGMLRAEVRTDGNAVVDGFSMEDCDGVRASDFAAAIAWKGRALSELAGQEVRIRFEFDRASLFTFALEE